MTTFRKFLKSTAKKYPKIAGIYRAFRYGPQIIPTPVMTPMGFKFSGSQAVQNGTYEPDETNLVKKLLADVDYVINIGANIGYYACIALKENVPVIAFEPIETNIQYLLNNLNANRFQSNCEVFPIALSDTVGIIKIYGGGSGASLIKGWAGTAEDFSCLVPSSTLDLVLGNRFNHERLLIIVDIEGAERRMLDAALKLLDMNPKPLWLIEINGSINQPKGVNMNPHFLETFEIFWQRGYESIMSGETMRHISRDEISNCVKTGNDITGSHNFLFFDKGLEPRIKAVFNK